MQALEVSVNGKRLCVAATMPNKVVGVGLTWTIRQSDAWQFNLGGVLGGDSNQHFAWNVPTLKTGDEVLLRIVETESPDSPDRVYDPKFNP